MKHLFIIFLLLVNFNVFATNIPLDSIKKEIVSFLKQNETYGTDNLSYESLSNDVIRDLRIKKPIKEGMNGIFTFNLVAVHQGLHLLLVDDSGFKIVNTRDNLDKNLEDLLAYFKRNEYYTKEDIMFYVSDLLRIKKRNMREDTRVA